MYWMLVPSGILNASFILHPHAYTQVTIKKTRITHYVKKARPTLQTPIVNMDGRSFLASDFILLFRNHGMKRVWRDTTTYLAQGFLE